MLVFDVASILDHMMRAVSQHMSRYQLAISEDKMSELAIIARFDKLIKMMTFVRKLSNVAKVLFEM